MSKHILINVNRDIVQFYLFLFSLPPFEPYVNILFDTKQ